MSWKSEKPFQISLREENTSLFSHFCSHLRLPSHDYNWKRNRTFSIYTEKQQQHKAFPDRTKMFRYQKERVNVGLSFIKAHSNESRRKGRKFSNEASEQSKFTAINVRSNRVHFLWASLILCPCCWLHAIKSLMKEKKGLWVGLCWKRRFMRILNNNVTVISPHIFLLLRSQLVLHEISWFATPLEQM